MKTGLFHWFAAALLLAAAPALAQGTPAKPAKTEKSGKDDKGETSPKAVAPLFASSDVIHLTIKAPFSDITRGAIPEEKPQPGTLSVVGAKPETLAVTLAPRGITRRKKEVCPFPPLAVVFPDKPGKDSLFHGQKKLKLVTHCKPSEGFQQYVLLEYAAYKLYNAMTAQSFNARLAQIDYIDASGKPMTTRYGFFIEDGDDMAARNAMVEEKMPDRIPAATLNPGAAVRYALFQDMISNLDWAMTAGAPGLGCCHNARLIGAKGATADIIPVPYDFDYSGLVDAPYAVPPAALQMANVRVRRYRGFCRHNAEVPAKAAALLGQRDQLTGVLDSVPGLDAGTRKKASAYLAGFFDQLGSPADIEAKLLKTCV